MPPITCHVLDTSSGAPAASVPVTLSLLSPSVSALLASSASSASEVATATTNSDGRITAWSSDFSIENGQVYKLRFETWEYFNGNTFFPYVEVTFVVNMEKDGRDHYHVPVLLAPWSYSTYRGS
ncbi:Transthyretin [Dactylella cylindrospora]|nr:Transthyretin [Dactylella cylindrospora]